MLNQFDHSQLLEVARLAFPDLQDDTEIITTQSNPYYAPGKSLGKYGNEPIKVDLKKYEFPFGENGTIVNFTAGTHKPELGDLYVIMQLTFDKDSEVLAPYTLISPTE